MGESGIIVEEDFSGKLSLVVIPCSEGTILGG